jgi:hypothetical protein
VDSFSGVVSTVVGRAETRVGVFETTSTVLNTGALAAVAVLERTVGLVGGSRSGRAAQALMNARKKINAMCFIQSFFSERYLWQKGQSLSLLGFITCGLAG